MTLCASFVLFLEHQTELIMKGDPPLGSVPSSIVGHQQYRDTGNVNLVAFLALSP